MNTRKRVLLYTLMLCLLMPALSLGEADDLDAFVDRAMRGAKVVGGTVVVYHRGQLVYARDYGWRNQTRKEPVDENTYFKTASITKMVTGIGLMTLKEQGLVDLDADISDYFGYRIANPKYTKQPLTLRQLMSHTASISEGGGYSRIKNTVGEMLALKHKRAGNYLAKAPGSSYQYSNFGAGLVGSIMEAVTNQSVQAYMAGAVFEPLHMDAAYNAGLLNSPQDVSSQYAGGKVSKSAALSIQDPHEDWADPERHYRITVGNVWMRARDLAKLTALLCEGGAIDGVRLLTPESVQEMMAEQRSLGLSVSGESPYGLFLEHNDTIIKGKTVWGHQGMSSGAIVNTYFEPDSGFVFTLLVNGSSMNRDNRVGKLARRLIGELYPRFAGE